MSTDEELVAKVNEYLPLFGEPILQIMASVFGQFTEEEFASDRAEIIGAAVGALHRTAAQTAIGAIVNYDERLNIPEIQDLVYHLSADLQNLTTGRVKQVRPILRAIEEAQKGADHGG